MNLSRVFLYSSALTMIASHAIAKYCVKLPTCEELGYIYSANKYPNNRSVKCPFDTKKILLLDYCQAYGLTSCDSTSGECDECIVEKADGTKSNSGYWRHTRCNAGYSYKSGECPPTEVDRTQYPYEGSEGLDESIGEIECVQSAQNTYCGYKSCNEGWNLNSGNCIVHDCGSAYPYTSCDANGTCEECKSGANFKYGEVICNSGYIKINNKCIYTCTTPGSCEIGDIYAYNNTPIGVVFANTSNIETKIVALSNINQYGDVENKELYWASASDYSWRTGATITSDKTIAANDINGKYNTNQILSYISTNGKTAQAATATCLYAPNICETGSICAKGNWYLPAAGELVTIRNNNNIIDTAINTVGGEIMNNNHYYFWSSTEHESNYMAWVILFNSTNVGLDGKYYVYYTRPTLQICANGKSLTSDGICSS